MSFEEIAEALGMTNKRAPGCIFMECQRAIRKLWRERVVEEMRKQGKMSRRGRPSHRRRP